MLNNAVIFDNGSGIFKAGMGDDDAPRIVFPTIVGKPENPNLMVGMDQKELYVGPEAHAKKSLLILSYPIKRGIIDDMESMEKIWQHTYENELVVDPKEHPVLLTEPPLNDIKKREAVMQLFFEGFNVNHFHLKIQGVLSLFSTGRTTGLVVDSGAGVTHTIPVYEGYALPFATHKLNIAGDDLTKYLESLLWEDLKVISKPTNKEAIEKMKEKLCYVAFDIDTSLKESDDKDKEIPFSLPDGQSFRITTQHFSCPEALFQPIRINGNDDAEGIHDKTYHSITKCEPHIRKDLYANIVLTGGSTMFKGLGVRLKKEVSALAPSTMNISMDEPLERKNSVWIGGSMLSTLPQFSSIWVTKQEFDEEGLSIVHKKCF